MKKTIRMAFLGLSIQAMNADAKTINGKIQITDGTTINYIYENESNTFGIDIENLIKLSKKTLKFDRLSEAKCDQIRNDLKNGIMNEQEVRNDLNQILKLNIEFSIMNNYKQQEFTNKIVEDLARKNINAINAKNKTIVYATELQPTFKWQSQAISVFSNEKSVKDSWEIISKDQTISVKVNIEDASPTLICDIQQGYLSLEAQYDLTNYFSYIELSDIKKETFMSLWSQINEKKESINDFAVKTDLLDQKNAKTLTNGIFLASELIKLGINPTSMEPGKLALVYTDYFDSFTGALKPKYSDKDAERRSNSFGKPVEIKLGEYKGTMKL